MDPASGSPEWTVMWTLKRALRSWIKPKDEQRPAIIADQVLKDLRESNWCLIKGPPSAGWIFDPNAIKLRQAQEREFEERLRALKDLARNMGHFTDTRPDDAG